LKTILSGNVLIATIAIVAMALLLAVLPHPWRTEVSTTAGTAERAEPALRAPAEGKSAGPAAPGKAATAYDREAVIANLVPHRALYRMKLGTAKGASGLVGAQGGMVYTFNETCDGFISENQSFLSFSYTEGQVTETSWNFSTWESRDGLSYRFALRQTRDGAVIEEIEGRAALDEMGGPGVARLTKPEEMEIELPAGTLFPAEHMFRMLALAEHGGDGMMRLLFDGASLDNPQEVNAVIGNRIPATKLDVTGAEKLAAQPAWPVLMAYFPLTAHTPEPDFEMTVRYRADGVAPRIVQDFGDFTLIGDIERVELYDKPACD
jgi:hypothetical protein